MVASNVASVEFSCVESKAALLEALSANRGKAAGPHSHWLAAWYFPSPPAWAEA